jgi:hypothetical protein
MLRVVPPRPRAAAINRVPGSKPSDHRSHRHSLASRAFLRFVSACKKVAEQEKRSLHIIRIGSSPEMDAIAAADPETFASHGDLNEESAICNFRHLRFALRHVSRGEKIRIISTHQPAHQSFHLRAGAKADLHPHASRSTLACVVAKYKIGEVCESELEYEIAFVTSANVPCHNTTSNAPEASLWARTRCNSWLAHFAAKTGKTFQESDCSDFSPAGGRPAMLR